MKTPVNKQTVSHHLAYNWWKYLLLAAFCFGLVDLIYTVTAYRTPEEKKVEFYVYGYADTDALDAYMENVRQTQMSDMEEMRSILMLNDSSYGPLQLTTYLAAGEGDLYLLPRDNFLTLAGQGAFLPLEEDAELMELFSQAGVSLQAGWRKNNETGENHLYGIPQDKLPGLSAYCASINGYLCATVSGRNDVNALKFMRILAADTLTPSEAEKEESGTQAAPDAPSGGAE